MRSVADRPESVCSAAVSVGAVVSGTSRLTLRAWLRVLPAASISVRVKALALMASATASKLKLPSAAVVVLAKSLASPVRRSPTLTPWSLRPTSLTMAVLVLKSPSGALSLAASRPMVVIAGKLVLSCSITRAVVEALPARSIARN